jgi:transcription elongation GreA/GreB family factor
MDKSLIFKTLIDELTLNLQAALTAAQNTYEIATNEDNKAENKYDTRGLEASYLAGAQAERVRDLKETLTVISNLQFKNFKQEDKIALTALVELQTDENTNWVLVLPKGGGQKVVIQKKTIKVITPESPLGQLLIGKKNGDEFTLNAKEYSISNIH